MFFTPELQLMSLTSNSSMDLRAFPSSVRNTAGPRFFMLMSVNVCQVFISFNHAPYGVLFSKDDGALKCDAINGFNHSLLPCNLVKLLIELTFGVNCRTQINVRFTNTILFPNSRIL